MTEADCYCPSHFLCMLCPRSDASDTDRSYNDFMTAAGAAPRISLSTTDFIVHLALSPSTHVAVDKKNQLTLVLHGEIYDTQNNQGSFLVEQFLNHGLDLPKHINGSFAILVIDKQNDLIALITDRINTHKVFYSKHQGNHWLSTSLYLHPTLDAPVDRVALASYLANGVVHNNRTLFDGIRILERACVHKMSQDGCRATKYWSFQFAGSQADIDKNKLTAELSELLIESVRIRLNDNPKLFLSLSGGYESTGILGILGSKLHVPDIDCFSYAFGDITANSDEHIAGQMATHYGYDHKIVQSYRGDLVDVIKYNATRGQGLANFCDEADAWMEMSKDFSTSPKSVLFVGDECFGRYPFEGPVFDSPIDVLANVFIYGFDSLFWLRGMIDDDAYAALHDGWQEEIIEIVKRCSSCHNHDDMKDFLHLDQLLTHRISPWREFFPGQHVVVRNPFLDNRLLDFVMKVPSSLRVGKRLYIETVTRMFPELFGFKRAGPPSYVPNWRREFNLQCRAIEKRLLSEESPLDAIIPRGVIVNLMKSSGKNTVWQKSFCGPQALPSKLLRKILRRYRCGRRLMRGHPNISGRVVDPTTFLKRVLVMRLFLSTSLKTDGKGWGKEPIKG